MSKDLYVRNISPEAGEDDLRRLFAVSGKVTYVHLVKDAKTGVFVGCAFVKMASEAEARDAIVTLDGALLIDRIISVVAALPQKPKGRRGTSPARSSHGPAKGGRRRSP